MGANSDKPECGTCGSTDRIWRTCAGPRCATCPCEAEKHGQHVYDYEWNGECCYVKDGQVIVEKVDR